MTRPRRQLVVIGDSETISTGGKFLKKWMSHLEEHADLRYPDPSELNIDLGSLSMKD
jgi:DNA polymerase alpha-associated DNA helicase A